jgi:hypothetical protein
MPFLRRFFSIFRARVLVPAFLLAGLVLISFCQPAFCGGKEGRPRFHATFLQLWDRHNDFSDSQWDDLCLGLKGFGVEEIILQWSLVTERPFLWRLSEGRRNIVPLDRVSPAPAVQSVVRAAERTGLRVRFGLTHDPNWWGEIKSEARLVGVYLNRLWQDQHALAMSLNERFGDSPSFAGFYVSQEIDDRTWLDGKKLDILSGHLQRLTGYLKEIKPDSSVAISCFFNGRVDPAHVTRFWRKMFSTAGLDFLYVQDGVGTGKLALNEVALYMHAVSAAAVGTEAEIRGIVEIFDDGGLTQENYDRVSGHFRMKTTEQSGSANFYGKFRPASMSRISRQLALAGSLLGPEIIAFSLPEYATPMGGKKGEQLGKDYRAYLERE